MGPQSSSTHVWFEGLPTSLRSIKWVAEHSDHYVIYWTTYSGESSCLVDASIMICAADCLTVLSCTSFSWQWFSNRVWKVDFIIKNNLIQHMNLYFHSLTWVSYNNLGGVFCGIGIICLLVSPINIGRFFIGSVGVHLGSAISFLLTSALKVGLSPSKKSCFICFNESYLKSCFYFQDI